MAKRILLVEDDSAVSRSFSLFLRHKGYDVDCAADGAEGLDLLRVTTYDLVVSDIMMPKMNGLEFLAAAKEHNPNLPIIMTTGYSDLDTAIEAMKKGAMDFITKPLRYETLEQTISTALARAGSGVDQGPDDLHARLERKVHELSVLYSINEAIETSDNIDDLFVALTELACNISEATSSAFFLFDRETETYYLKHGFSRNEDAARPASFQFGKDLDQRLDVERVPIVWNDAGALDFYSVAAVSDRAVESLMLAPLFVRNENFGVLAIENKMGDAVFTETDTNFVNVLLQKASLQIENNALYETIYANLVSTLRSLVTTLEAKDHYTQQHSDRVTRISILIAKEVGCSSEELSILRFAAMLHDIGKIGISDAILQKRGRLTDDEYEVVKQHPSIGARILEPLGMLPHEKAIIRHHHERWDGHGYPERLAGRDIPFLARIVSLADAYEAMTSDRVYRVGLSHEVALAEIGRNEWHQFDGNLAKAFAALCEKHKHEITKLLA